VERVQWLETKRDASEEKFDKLTFYVKMTALFVEVLTVTDPPCGQENQPAMNKGKGREGGVKTWQKSCAAPSSTQ
jgi:hypothetical protein